MDCRILEEKLSGFLDGALPAEETSEVQTHLSGCDSCRKALSELRRLDAVLKEYVPREEAPAHLRGKVSGVVRLEEIRALIEIRGPMRKFLPAAGIALACLAVALWLWQHSAAGNMAQAAITNHISSLAGKLPAEVKNADRGRVASWFEGKLPFHVEVPDLSAEGFQLAGGRLCHLKGNDVAYLVYRKEGKKLSLFVTDCTTTSFPAKDGRKAVMASKRGYHAACWRKGEIGYILVSDLAPESLESLAESILAKG